MRPATGMLASSCITTSGLFLNTLTLAAIVQPMLGRRSDLSSSTTLGTASGGALDPLATHPPAFGPKPAFAGGPDLTINVVNSFGSPLSIFYGSNVGAPTPVNNPGSGTLSSSTQVLFPSGWAGRITIGGNFDPKGSKIEASYSSPNYVPDVDISYVDGYSVPITCSCYGVAVTGCNSKPRYHILSAQSRVADLEKQYSSSMTATRAQVQVRVRSATTPRKTFLMVPPHRSSRLALVLHIHTPTVRYWFHKKPL